MLLDAGVIGNLARKKYYSYPIVLTLAFALSLLFAMASLNYYLLVKPLPYENQSRLYALDYNLYDPQGRLVGTGFSYPGLMHLYDNPIHGSTSAMVSYEEVVVSSDKGFPIANVAYISPEYYELFNLSTIVGRTHSYEEGVNNHTPLAVISYQRWHDDYEADENIIGKTIGINGVSFEIVGVASKTFQEPQLLKAGQVTEAWLSWEFNGLPENRRNAWGNLEENLFFISKISAEPIPEDDTKLFNKTIIQGWSNQGKTYGWKVAVETNPLKNKLLGDISKFTILFLVCALGIVLIGMANLSSLFLARAAETKKYTEIRLVHGATQADIFKLALSESISLVGLACIFGLVLTWFWFEILQTYLAEMIPRSNELKVGLEALIIAVILSILIALFFAKILANYDRNNQFKSLRGSGKGATAQVTKARRTAIYVLQAGSATLVLSLSISVLIGVIVMVYQPKGFDMSNTVQIRLTDSKLDSFSEEGVNELGRQVYNALIGLNEVESVSVGKTPILGFDTWGVKDVLSNEVFTPKASRVDHEYFDLLNQPFVSGQGFSREQVVGAANVVVVNEALAGLLNSNGGSILGNKLVVPGNNEPSIIVGVVAGVDLPNHKKNEPTIYAPNDKFGYEFIVKVRSKSEIENRKIEELVKKVSSSLGVEKIEDVQFIYFKSIFTEVASSVISMVLSIFTFLLVALGIYGVQRYSVFQKKTEIGTRMSIGASRMGIFKLFFKDVSVASSMGFIVSGGIIVIAVYIGGERLGYVINYIDVGYLISIFLVGVILALSTSVALKDVTKKPISTLLKNT